MNELAYYGKYNERLTLMRFDICFTTPRNVGTKKLNNIVVAGFYCCLLLLLQAVVIVVIKA